MARDYKRNRTTTLFAALNMLDGTVIGECMRAVLDSAKGARLLICDSAESMFREGWTNSIAVLTPWAASAPADLHL
jgi:hypothetical protein